MDIFTFYINKFNEESTRTLAAYLTLCKQYGQKILPIIIDSYGGEAYALYGMISMIEEAGIEIMTICHSKAMSCGAVLFALGKQRYLGKHATVLVHQPSNIAIGTSADIKSESQETERIKLKSYEILDKACNKESGYFDSLMKQNDNADLFLTPEKCLEIGLATQIGIPSLYDLFPEKNNDSNFQNSNSDFENYKILMNYQYKDNPETKTTTEIKPILNKKEVSKSMTEEEIKAMQEKLKKAEEENNRLKLEADEQKKNSLNAIRSIEKEKDSVFVQNLIMNRKILPAKKDTITEMLNMAVDTDNQALRDKIKEYFSNETVEDKVASVPKMQDTPNDTKTEGIETELKKFAEAKGLSLDKDPLGVYLVYSKEKGGK